MTQLDWIVLLATLATIIIYGVWKSRGQKDINDFLLGSREAKWWLVGLSVMATQASAITFLSTPGQAYSDGMRFVQFYFGLPLAMIVICIVFIPRYYKLNVFTAYEYLESTFDLKSRTLASILFLIQRGLGAGITIYAPSIILSTLLGWNLNLTCLLIGSMVIIYTVSGGTKAVSQTHKLQMLVIMVGMFIAFFLLLEYLPGDWSLGEALTIAGSQGRMNVIDLSFDFNERYTFWSGITGGFFLALAYFGTDQSQVQRYLSGKSIRESRMGLMFNGLLKIPLQFFILFVGVLVFIFYQTHRAPVFFNENELELVQNSNLAPALENLESTYTDLIDSRATIQNQLVQAKRNNQDLSTYSNQLQDLLNQENLLRDSVKAIIAQVSPTAETNDRDYVFLHFIINHLPKGLVGLLLAMILSAAMSSTASELNALASTTTVDIYKRSFRRQESQRHYMLSSKWFTLMWGLIAILFALFGTLAENLIQFVNIVGSIFYGVILGMFLMAFFAKTVRGTALFIAALLAQLSVILLFLVSNIGYLWFNVIGCLLVIVFSYLIQIFLPPKNSAQ